MNTKVTADDGAGAGVAGLRPVVLRSECLGEVPGLVSAVLRENSNDMSVLTLTFAGWGEEWVSYMRPVTLFHRERVLFHGKVTAFSRSNDAGDMMTTVTVSNLFWVLQRQPLGAQIAEIKASMASERAANIWKSAVNAMSSWASMAESAEVVAPGWVVNADGSLAVPAVISLDASRAGFALGVNVKRRVLTAWSALLEMQGANPDALFRVDYTRGVIEVVSVGNAQLLAWDTARQDLCRVGELTALYEEAITGVAVVVTWQTEVGGGTIVAKWPEGLDLSATGVRVFSGSADSRSHAEAQAANLLRQCKVYYDAVNELQWSGGVTARLEFLERSPLCCRLSLQGDGAHESWRMMCGVVTEVEWDFGQGLVTLTLGRQLDDPQLTELQFPDLGAGEDGSGGGDVPPPDGSISTAASGSTTPGTTTPPLPSSTTTTTTTTTRATTTTTGIPFLGFMNPVTNAPVSLQSVLESSRPVPIGVFGNQHFDEGFIYARGSSGHPGYIDIHAVYAWNGSDPAYVPHG